MVKFLIFALTFFGFIEASWEGEYWQYLNWTQVEKGAFRFYAVAEVRFNKDMSRFSYFRIAENFAYEVLPNLDIELHYSYLYTKSFGATRFNNRNRLELEINPSAPLGDVAIVRWRNRLEWLKDQGDPKIYTLLRHRTAIAFKVENWGKLTNIQMSDEVIYDFEINKITQNRFIPLELTFALSKHTTLDLFFIIRRVFSFGLNRWYGSYVLGTELNF